MKTSLKRNIAFLLTLLLLGSTASCGGTTSEETTL